jgi:gas vesicle protein
MKLQDIKDMNKEDFLGAIGLAVKPSTGQWLAGTLSVFGVGLLVGAGAALLFAPRPGRELREDLIDRAKTLKDRTAARVNAAAESAIT